LVRRSRLGSLAAVVAALTALIMLAAACSSGDDDDGAGRDGGGGAAEEDDGVTIASADRPDGPVATIAGPLDGGGGLALASAATGPTLDDVGYVEDEYTASGTATSYKPEEGDFADLPTDGTFTLVRDAEADYATRLVVRRPAEAADFNGTVVVEWFNVSGGLDAAPDYTYLSDELLRGGYAWVGISVQRIGIEGGDVAVTIPGLGDMAGAGTGLKAQDPERYGDLSHPGDAFSYDIYTQVARALREPAGSGSSSDDDAVDPLDGLEVERMLAVGESQSAFALTTYVNGVQPLTQMFDGFLIHSRGGSAAPLGEPDKGIDVAGSIGGKPTQVRTDGEAPVMVVETETDLLGILSYLPARQDDSERFRLWEIAGTAHADKFQIGPVEEALGCSQPINRGQQAYVLRAALRSLDTWVSDGTAPPEADRLSVDTDATPPAYVLDDLGIAGGGIRTPAVDAPVDVLSGMPGPDSSIICLLMGTTTPLDDTKLAGLYESRDQYEADYEAATDAMIDAGFALGDDRDLLLAEADPSRLPE
jgi:hypothetical protein